MENACTVGTGRDCLISKVEELEKTIEELLGWATTYFSNGFAHKSKTLYVPAGAELGEGKKRCGEPSYGLPENPIEILFIRVYSSLSMLNTLDGILRSELSKIKVTIE